MWKRKKREHSVIRDKAAGKIAKVFLYLQVLFAKAMNTLVAGMAPKKLKLALISFCLLSGGFSIYLAAHAVLGTKKKQPVFNVKPLSLPQYIDQSGSEINEGNTDIPAELYQEVQNYKRYMDSSGEKIRPGLLDTIKILEQIYQTQK